MTLDISVIVSGLLSSTFTHAGNIKFPLAYIGRTLRMSYIPSSSKIL